MTLGLGCLDPRFPVDVTEATSVYVPPKIDEDLVEPNPATSPFAVNIGAGCQKESFRLGRVVDPDLENEGRLLARWQLTVRIDVQEFGPTLLEEVSVVNTSTETGIDLALPDFSIDKQLLSSKFLGQVPALVGGTHLLEVHVTDASFVADTFTVSPDSADADSAYWWIRIEEDVCVE